MFNVMRARRGYLDDAQNNPATGALGATTNNPATGGGPATGTPPPPAPVLRPATGPTAPSPYGPPAGQAPPWSPYGTPAPQPTAPPSPWQNAGGAPATSPIVQGGPNAPGNIGTQQGTAAQGNASPGNALAAPVPQNYGPTTQSTAAPWMGGPNASQPNGRVRTPSAGFSSAFNDARRRYQRPPRPAQGPVLTTPGSQNGNPFFPNRNPRPATW